MLHGRSKYSPENRSDSAYGFDAYLADIAKSPLKISINHCAAGPDCLGHERPARRHIDMPRHASRQLSPLNGAYLQ